MRDKTSLNIPDDARKQATLSIRQYFADELGHERDADLAALCHHEEFPYWPTAARRRK